MPRLPPDEVPINLDSVTPTPSGFGSPLIVEQIDEWRTPAGFFKRIRESLGMPEYWYSDTIAHDLLNHSRDFGRSRKLVAHPPSGETRARLLSDLLTPLTLHGAGSHADSPTGRTTRHEPELQRLPWNTPKRRGWTLQCDDIFAVDYAKLERDFVEMHGAYECKLAPVFDNIPATHEIVDPKPREWSGPDEPPRVGFRVSAATVLSLGGGS